MKELVAIGKEYAKLAAQWLRGYGGAAPTDSDRPIKSGSDSSKGYE